MDIQKDSSELDFTEVEEEPFIEKEKTAETLKDKLISLLKSLSQGTYRTPLHFLGTDIYSTLLTSILSLIALLTLLTFTVMIFIPIFSKDQYLIDKRSVGFNKYVLNVDPINQQPY